ncbi:rRNA maturation RNase YbeY [Galbibacter sp. BG1]|uniref:rRNA maturation RNase YbeY n=1 Tax=Galbibacter sp. BG1 TaxID=1170699 RepID=UPI0015C019AB|nr:rRNA maturation RNase YbeY [Galbibacter sp. BG1]QLE01124.1 rRNA maturation RNase YbeY [Galbibacter sp. BG1]
MISFNYETEFKIDNEEIYGNWIKTLLESESKNEGEINYIFCDDAYLHKINVEYLNHDTLTDIISFDYSNAHTISGDIFISIERVRENADEYQVDFEMELKRVMAHGILHYCGYKDKTIEDTTIMRSKEEEKIALF